MRVGTLSIAALTGALGLTSIGHASNQSDVKAHAITTIAAASYLPDSTQAVCALTGEHGRYKEMPFNYTVSKYGMISGDSGSSFEYEGKVWWLFGNTGASQHAPWEKANQTSRWPLFTGTFNSAADQGSDSIATSSFNSRPPAPVLPYNNTTMPPDQRCPTLTFVTQTSPQAPAFVNPSVFPDPDPSFTGSTKYFVSLRRGELPETGVGVGQNMYVVFGTDNPANCMSTGQTVAGPCMPLPDNAVNTTCGAQKDKDSRTRSVMALYMGNGRFKGLYDISAPTPRYAPLCPTAPDDDDARFVNVQMQNGGDGYIYLWGTEGGANNNASPVYLARIPAAHIATGAGTEYWNGLEFLHGPKSDPQSIAKPIFTDSPNACAAQLGVQYNQYLGVWLVGSVPLQRDARARWYPERDLHALCRPSAGTVERSNNHLRSGAGRWDEERVLLLHLLDRNLSAQFVQRHARFREEAARG